MSPFFSVNSLTAALFSGLHIILSAAFVLSGALPGGRVFAEDNPPVAERNDSGTVDGTPTVQLGNWHVIGPFKDKLHGLHHISFNHVFDVEKHAVLSAGELVDLSKSWAADNFPGEDDTVRHWRERPDWKDGYLNYLPHGPAPMRNETCYLVRTITAAQPMVVRVRIDALDAIRLWLDGSSIVQP